MPNQPCKYWIKEDRLICQKNKKPCACDGNAWYCDWPKKKGDQHGKKQRLQIRSTNRDNDSQPLPIR